MRNVILCGDVIDKLKTIPDEYVDMCVTSPPYWGLRNYSVDGQIGLEPTLDEWVQKMVSVFVEVRRVLKPWGTLWLNLGDSFTDKQLMGQPWRVAFALQADGWYLRSDCIWHKPNPMPESVTDRPTKSHEYLFLLAKQPRYYYDQEAIKEASSQGDDRARNRECNKKQNTPGQPPHNGLKRNDYPTRNRRTVWQIATQPLKSVVSGGSYRIALPGCPDHGCRACRFHVQRCDAQQAASWFGRSLGKHVHLGQAREGVGASIDVDHPEFPFDAIFATDHNNEIHRKEDGLRLRETFSGRSFSRTGYMEGVHHSCAIYAHIRENNIEPDFFSDVKDFCLLAQMPFHKTCISTCCHYTVKTEKRQDHYAAFPEALVEPCVRAGTSERGNCAKCGRPWERVVNRDNPPNDGTVKSKYTEGTSANRLAMKRQAARERGYEFVDRAYTTGWRPTCECEIDETIRPIVLDPFAGAGTVGVVCKKLKRDFLGVELNSTYVEMANRRIEKVEVS